MSFEDLRSALQRPASRHTWDAVVDILSRDHGPAHLEEVLLPYARDILSRWPSHIRRRAPRHWFLRKSGYGVRAKRPPTWTLVDTFHLANARARPHNLQTMIETIPWDHITGLDLHNVYVGREVVAALTSNIPHDLELFRMVANHNQTKTMLRSIAGALIESGRLDGVTHLELADHSIGTRAAAELFDRRMRPVTLSLRGNRLGGQSGTRRLVACDWLPHVTHLDLSFNHFIPETADVLATADNISGLTWLNLAGNPSLQVQHLEAMLPRMPQLRFLDLSGTGMTSEQVEALRASTSTHLHWPHPFRYDRTLQSMRATEDDP